ncbi:hypothetical protein AOQ84DRAFT_386177 [Glonium stellatum]|uniref:BTB domain-containing protein n=1 Tax=Glonium stellatum TaxID=574774 RepID=A0A8E2JWR8_9PEZI|nr:hypothetical protein AOQ84DRAFT_386177 [Glonium stellatum]
MELSEPRTELMSSLKELLVSGSFSDLTILCGPNEHKVHKAVICPRSEFFNAACRFGKEAETGIITLSDDDPETVRLMIEYFYTLEYSPLCSDIVVQTPVNVPNPADSDSEFIPDDWGRRKDRRPKPHPKSTKPTGPSHFTTFAKLYAIADKYNIKGLQTLSQRKFKLTAESYWNHDDLPSAIHTVYTSTPDTNMGLRNIVVNLIADRMSLLRKPEMEALMREFNGLAFDLLKLKYINDGGLWS